MAELLNVDIARRLEEAARLLKEPGANPYRLRAYHRAATTRRWLGCSVTEMLQQEGVEGLRKLPGLGESLTRTIHDLVVTGRRPRLDRLRGEMAPVSRFASVPGIGTVLVEHLHCDLGIATLEELDTFFCGAVRRAPPQHHLFCYDRQHPSVLPLSLAKINGLWYVASGILGLELNSRHEWESVAWD